MPAQVRIEYGVLQHGAYLFAYLVCGLLPEPGKIAFGRIHHAHEHAQRGGLAAAVRPEHTEHLAAMHFQVYTVYGSKTAEALGEIMDRKY